MIHAASAPSVDSTLGLKLLPSVLGLTTGAVDVISFLGLARLLAGGLEALGLATLRPLLALQALLLTGPPPHRAPSAIHR